ncbi:MAG: carbon monoxide dehydrogenase subunit G [Gammaproteobacteria bacterium]|jgi:carbon monoxide dehydrogenase subunit G
MNKRALLILFGLLLLPAITSAHGPSRQKVVKEIEIKASAEKVWGLISDFCAIKTWLPPVTECESDGTNNPEIIRTLTLENGEILKEKLLKHDPQKMMYQYMIDEANVKAVPVSSYGSSITVKASENGTTIVTWKSGFYRGYMNNNPPPELNDEAAVNAISAIYDVGLANIKKLAEQ